MNTKDVKNIKNKNNDVKKVLCQDEIIWKFKNIMDPAYFIGQEYKYVEISSTTTIRITNLDASRVIDKYIFYEGGYSYIGIDGNFISRHLKEVNNFFFSFNSNKPDFEVELLISSDNRRADSSISGSKYKPSFTLDKPISPQGKYFIFKFNLEDSELKKLPRYLRISLR